MRMSYAHELGLLGRQNVEVGGQQGNAKHDDDYCAYDVGKATLGFCWDFVAVHTATDALIHA